MISIGIHEDSFQLVGTQAIFNKDGDKETKERQRQRFSQYAFTKYEPFTVQGGGSMALQRAGDSASLDKRGRRHCSQLDLDFFATRLKYSCCGILFFMLGLSAALE